MEEKKQKLLIVLPYKLAERMKEVFTRGERTKIITRLIKDEVDRRFDEQEQALRAIEQDRLLGKELEAWKFAFNNSLDEEVSRGDFKERYGDIFRANLGPTADSGKSEQGLCIVMGTARSNQMSQNVMVIPILLSDSEKPAWSVPVKYLGKKGVALCKKMGEIDKKRLMEPVGKLSKAKLQTLSKVLKQSLGVH